MVGLWCSQEDAAAGGEDCKNSKKEDDVDPSAGEPKNLRRQGTFDFVLDVSLDL